MPTLNELRKRLAKLETGANGNVVLLTALDKTIRRMKAKRFYEVCCEAVYGVNSEETAIVLSAVADTSGSKIRELLQMVVD